MRAKDYPLDPNRALVLEAIVICEGDCSGYWKSNLPAFCFSPSIRSLSLSWQTRGITPRVLAMTRVPRGSFFLSPVNQQTSFSFPRQNWLLARSFFKIQKARVDIYAYRVRSLLFKCRNAKYTLHVYWLMFCFGLANEWTLHEQMEGIKRKETSRYTSFVAF